MFSLFIHFARHFKANKNGVGYVWMNVALFCSYLRLNILQTDSIIGIPMTNVA